MLKIEVVKATTILVLFVKTHTEELPLIIEFISVQLALVYVWRTTYQL